MFVMVLIEKDRNGSNQMAVYCDKKFSDRIHM